MSQQSTPQRQSYKVSTPQRQIKTRALSTPKREVNSLTTPQTPSHPSTKLTFRKDGSLIPDPNPIKLTSPITLSTPKQTLLNNMTDTDLDARLRTLLSRFFSPLNDENIFMRTLGKLSAEMELEILGDTDGWEFLEGNGKEEMSRERKLWLVELYGVFDGNMRGVLRQAGTYN